MKLINRPAKTLAMACLAMSMLVTAGCQKVDGIDFDDIDTTIGVDLQQFKLPANNSTHKVVLDEVFDIDTTSCIKVDATDGHYYFTQQGERVSPTSISVDPIVVTTAAMNFYPKTLSITLSDLGITLPAMARGAADDSRRLGATIQTFEVAQDGLTGDVVSITRAQTADVPITMAVRFSDDLRLLVKKLGGLTLVLPDYMMLRQQARILQGAASEIVVDGSEIRFKVVDTSADLVFQITAVGLDFTTETDPSAANYLGYDRETCMVNMRGELYAYVDFDSAFFDVSPENLVRLSGGGNLSLSSEMTVGEIRFQEVTGVFQPHIAFTVGDMHINNVPAMLNDNDVNLRLHNPQINLDIESSMPLTGVVDATLTSHFKDGTTAQVTIPGIEVRKCDDTGQTRTSHIVVKRQRESSDNRQDCQYIYVSNLSDIISSIPEYVAFDCNATAKADEVATIRLGESFTFRPAYSVEAPLTLDPGSYINYTDSIDGWADDLEDVDLYDVRDAYVEITALATNTLPVDLEVEVTPVDVAKRTISGISVKIADADGNSRIAGNAERQPLTIHLGLNSESDFKRLDGIKIRAYARVNETFTLNSGTADRDDPVYYLKLDNVGATLNARLKINLDD